VDRLPLRHRSGSRWLDVLVVVLVVTGGLYGVLAYSRLLTPVRFPLFDHNLDEIEPGKDHRLIQVVGALESDNTNPSIRDIRLKLTEVHAYDESSATVPNKICIDRLIVWSYISDKNNEPSTLGVTNDGFGSEQVPITCIPMRAGFGQIPIAVSSMLSASAGITDPNWLYPYDAYSLNYRLEAIYRLLSSDDQELDRGRIDCKYYVDLRILGWDGTSGQRDDKSYPLKADVFRPLSLRLFVPITALAILCLLLAIWSVTDLGVIVQASTALALGIWLIRQSLVPSAAPGTMAIDLVFWCEYVLLVAIVILAIVRNWLSTRALPSADAKQMPPSNTRMSLQERRSGAREPIRNGTQGSLPALEQRGRSRLLPLRSCLSWRDCSVKRGIGDSGPMAWHAWRPATVLGAPMWTSTSWLEPAALPGQALRGYRRSDRTRPQWQRLQECAAISAATSSSADTRRVGPPRRTIRLVC